MLRDLPSFEVLMVRRQQMIDFMSGAMVFPGGKVEMHDLDPEWRSSVSGWENVPDHERGPRIAALREAFEESGILLGAPGFRQQGDETVAARKAIEAGALRFVDFVREKAITLDLTALTLFSRWLTPEIVPKRFDTFFYLATASEGQEAISDGRETEAPEWIGPGLALSLAAEGKRTIVFPTRMNLKLLAESSSLEEAVRAARRRDGRTITPRVALRDGARYLQLDAVDGYGDVDERLEIS
jgi:8-oxo-dGTP pyrophosphatase MutT (NUDIX family)